MTASAMTPVAEGEQVELRDGSAVVVRAVQPSDAARLVEGFRRLSLTSRRSRFLAAKHELTEKEVRYLTDVDHWDHEAIGALDAHDGRGVAVARYVRSRTDAQVAEVAVTVVDQWQRRGLGLELLRRLARRARAAGIHSFTALVSADNDAMIGLLRRSNGVELVHVDRDVAEYEISLARFTRSGAYLRWG